MTPFDDEKNFRLFEDTSLNIVQDGLPETQEDLGISSVLIDAINKAWQTIDNYNSILATLNSMDRHEFDGTIADILVDHHKEIGLLQGMLEIVSPNAKNVEEGKDELEVEAPEEVEKELPDTEQGNAVIEEALDKDEIKIDGQLKDLDVDALVDKAEESEESINKNYSFKNKVYHITIDNSSDDNFVDIVVSDKNNEHQTRVLLQAFDSMDELRETLNEWISDEVLEG